MFVVIFRATIRQLDDEYTRTAARLRELALAEFGCLRFEAFTAGNEEVAISDWKTEADIRAWREHPEHRAAQRRGREHWYESFLVRVARVEREYDSAASSRRDRDEHHS
jgi:heme-degrading monooxygenase HmoA